MKKNSRIMGRTLFVLYILFLLYFLIFSDWYGRSGIYDEFHYNLVPFQEILRYWNHKESLGIVAFANIAGNVIVFLPFGFLEVAANGRRNILRTAASGFLWSFIVEIFQLVSMVGSFDVDDLLLNTIGTVLGYLAFVLYDMMRRAYVEKRA